jgi:hypothetical protein
MNFFTFLTLLLVSATQLPAQDSVAFRPKDNFEVKIDMQFVPRPPDDPNNVQLGHTQPRKNTGALLPYLKLRITFFGLATEEVRYKVENNLEKRMVSKKISKTPVVELDAGFTDDIKAGLRPNEYEITLMNSEKVDLSRILIQIEKDGTFLVNREKRGKF